MDALVSTGSVHESSQDLLREIFVLTVIHNRTLRSIVSDTAFGIYSVYPVTIWILLINDYQMAKKYVHGRAGGTAVFEKYGADYMSDLSKDYHRKRRRRERMEQKGTLIKKTRGK